MQVIAGIACFFVIWFIVPYANGKLDEYRLLKLCRKQHAIILAVDDRPCTSLTPMLLILLAEFHVCATLLRWDARLNLIQKLVS